MIQIVVLDGHTLNPGDLSWDGLRQLGACTIYDRTRPDQIVHRAAEAEIVLTNKTVLEAEHLTSLPRLRYIGVLATGFNVVDLQAARERWIPVANVPAYSTASVIQLTFALLFALTHRVGEHALGVRQGAWSACSDFCYWDYPLIELAGSTFGLVGYGRIGRGVARVAAALGMSVLLHTRTQPTVLEAGIQHVDLESLLRSSDVVSLHCPLTPQTRGLMNAERLSWMKPSAYLLNTARGGLLDEAALVEALNSGRLAGAGLDVLSTEPPPADHPLLGVRNCIITPHLGWATLAARRRLMDIAVANVRAFLGGFPQNVVNGVEIIPGQRPPQDL